jgi:hypothetical protein
MSVAVAVLLLLAGKTTPLDGSWHLLVSLLFSSQIFTDGYPVVFLGWTLEYEMLFYLLFAIGLAVPIRNGPLIVPTIVITGLSVLFPITIALEFIAGMIVARMYLSGCGTRLSGTLLLLLGVITLLGSTIWPQPLGYRWITWGIPATMIVYGAIFTGQLHLRPIVFLGDASYSIYLIQAVTISLTFKIMLKVWPNLFPEFQIFIATVCTAFAGVFMYVALERPLINVMKRK